MNDTERFIDMVFEPDDIVEMRFYGDGKSIKKEWHYAKDLSQHFNSWHRLNRRGYHVSIGINPRKEFNVSGDVNVLLARYFFADFDDIEPGDGCGIWEFVSDTIYNSGIDLPDFAVFSGHGIHTYWKLPEPMTDLERWRRIQTGITETLNTDRQVKNPERVMRLPGFINTKKMNKPVDCFIL